MQYQTVLFDLDYTLGDATEGILACFRYALDKMNAPIPEDDVLRGTIGHTLEDSFTIVTGESAPEQRETFRSLYSRKADQIMARALQLYPQTLPLLQCLRQNHCVMAVVSTRPVTRLETMLDVAGARPFFRTLIGVDSIPNPKPDPAGLLEAIRRCGGKRETTLYIGDTVIDAEAAQRAGIDFAAVCTGMTKREAFSAFPARLVAEHLGELQQWLE